MNLVKRHIKELISLCDQYNVDKMYLFGSALSSKFNDKSDVDFLVTFKTSEIDDYFDNYLDFKENLIALLGRDVDLLEEQSLRNPILIKSINESKELVYGR
jgi:predicted nucleotidyltransferase